MFKKTCQISYLCMLPVPDWPQRLTQQTIQTPLRFLKDLIDEAKLEPFFEQKDIRGAGAVWPTPEKNIVGFWRLNMFT